MGMNALNRSRFGRLNRTAPQGNPGAGGGAGGNGTGTPGAPANPAGSAGAKPPSGTGDDWAPTTRGEFEALQKRLTKVNSEAAKYRLRAKALGAGGDPDPGAGDPPKAPAKPAEKPAVDAATTRTLEHLKNTAVNAQIKADLTAAGFQNPTKDRIARALRMIDRSAIDLDDDGEI